MSARVTARLAGSPQPGVAALPGNGIPLRRTAEKAGYALFALFVFFTCFTFLRPSPYDFFAVPTILGWVVLGLKVPRAALMILCLLFVYLAGTVVALMPYLDETIPVEWTYQFAYLIGTAVFFILFFSDSTIERVRLGLQAYLASCLFAAICGILSYFDVLGGEVFFKSDGRAAGVFEDPNLLGSFLILALLYLVHNILTGRARHVVATIVGLVILLAGIFLSFSRGSWGAMVLGLGLMIALTWYSSPSAELRRRIAVLTMLAVLCAGILIGGLMSLKGVSETFSDRAQVTKDYDEGETGRFGNQARAIPLLLERPLGFGPLRWRRTFELDPHNSYLGSFGNGGWAAGFAFIGIVLTTTFVGFRLCLVASPYQRYAQIVWPALLMFFLQALQIDIEKWRHVYIMFGMLWGLEAARWAWLRQQAANLATATPSRPLGGAFTRAP